MSELITHTNLPCPDDFYEQLIQAHHALSTEQSHAMNAALVLLLANHIGNIDVLTAALEHARLAAIQLDGAPTHNTPT